MDISEPPEVMPQIRTLPLIQHACILKFVTGQMVDKKQLVESPFLS